MSQGYDYHFMVLAPGLQSAWFFQAARRFWQHFQPVVTDDPGLLAYLPANSRVAVTVLARRDTAEYVQGQIETYRPDAYIDLIALDDLPLMESILNQRAEAGLPFG